ncbi:class I SAM-dependent methyltransferase [Streptomyces sp. NPDC058086]|uniref:class I SAM-dependent methyltransferase n=1 Tax=Streptomyces sp. NPDC058086 TaxID=3346334 RepID=UPI0036F088BC
MNCGSSAAPRARAPPASSRWTQRTAGSKPCTTWPGSGVCDLLALRSAGASRPTRYASSARYDERSLRASLTCFSAQLPDRARVVLDVGAGTGTGVPTRALREMISADVIALDLSWNMARQVSGRPTAVVADAQRLPVRDACADGVLLMGCIHLMPDPLSVMREARRVLRSGGCIAVATVLREDLQRQVFHQNFPEFHAFDLSRHFSLGDLEGLASHTRMDLRAVHETTADIVFPDAVSLIDFVRNRPFFGLRQMPQHEFESGFEAFARRVKECWPEGAVHSENRTITVVFGAQP